MSKILANTMLASMLAGLPTGYAQSKAIGQAPAAAEPSAPALVIGSGDLIDVTVFDAPELSGKFRVDQKGDVEVPLLPAIHVAGSTAGEAAKLIDDKFVEADILVPNGPRPSVFIEEYANQGITVSGEVKNPGIYPAFGVRMLNDVVTAAGGITELASSNVIITRRNEPNHPTTIRYDPVAFPRVIPEVQIYPGDTVLLPRAGIIYVLGAVNKAGGFLLNGHEIVTAEKAMALAGGTGRAPALNKAQLMRNVQGGRKVMITVRLDHILEGKAPDISLLDGDVLYVPTSRGKLAAQQAITSAIGIGSQVAIYKTALQ